MNNHIRQYKGYTIKKDFRFNVYEIYKGSKILKHDIVPHCFDTLKSAKAFIDDIDSKSDRFHF